MAFQIFEQINELKDVVLKHRAWLKQYEGLHFTIAKDKKDLILWQKEKEKYVYSDKLWQGWYCESLDRKYLYAFNINKIQRKKNITIIEFDGENTQKYLQEVRDRFVKEGIGFIRSSHGGKCDYLWVEFNRELTEKEVEKFLLHIAPAGSEIDLNFKSDSKRFPVLFAEHWKYGTRELPIEYFKGEQIDYDAINFKEETNKKVKKSFNKGYFTATVFTRRGQAEAFIKNNPMFFDKSGIFWRWNFDLCCYEIADEVEILNDISDKMNIDTINATARGEILNSLKQVGRLNLPKPIKKTWIQFKDEIYDINTGEIFKATSEYFVTNPIPYSLHKQKYEETPVMDRIFEEWVGKDYVQTLYEIVAYCLLADYPLNRLFCFVGAGMNGKSCFLNLIRKFLGNNNCTSTELDRLLESRFEVTRLHKKLLCLMGETNFNEIQNTSILKQLTGNDLIGFEYKNKNPFEDNNYAKIIIATNNLPTTTDKSDGFYRRWLIIDFPNQFSEKKDILADIPEEEYESLALKCCVILKELLKKRNFSKEGSIEDRREKYEAKSNFLEKFIKDNTIEEVNGFITKAEFSRNLSAWCKENRHRSMSDTSLGIEMKKLGYENSTKHFDWMNDGRGGTGRVWLGLKWKN